MRKGEGTIGEEADAPSARPIGGGEFPRCCGMDSLGAQRVRRVPLFYLAGAPMIKWGRNAAGFIPGRWAFLRARCRALSRVATA